MTITMKNTVDVQDIATMVGVLDILVGRGTVKANEMSVFGALYNKFKAVVDEAKEIAADIKAKKEAAAGGGDVAAVEEDGGAEEVKEE